MSFESLQTVKLEFFSSLFAIYVFSKTMKLSFFTVLQFPRRFFFLLFENGQRHQKWPFDKKKKWKKNAKNILTNAFHCPMDDDKETIKSREGRRSSKPIIDSRTRDNRIAVSSLQFKWLPLRPTRESSERNHCHTHRFIFVYFYRRRTSS